MLKALTSLLIAGAAALAIASPASAAVDCTDGPPDEVAGPYWDHPFPGSYIAYFDINNFCTGSSLMEIYTIDWPGINWYDYGHYGVIDGFYGPENILVTVWDGTDFDTFYLNIDP